MSNPFHYDVSVPNCSLQGCTSDGCPVCNGSILIAYSYDGLVDPYGLMHDVSDDDSSQEDDFEDQDDDVDAEIDEWLHCDEDKQWEANEMFQTAHPELF